MNPDDELCLCFHVSLRKVRNWIRLHRPQRAGQLSECFGAGTGCGWCRPWLEKLFEENGANRDCGPDGEIGDRRTGDSDPVETPSAAEYRQNRQAWIRQK